MALVIVVIFKRMKSFIEQQAGVIIICLVKRQEEFQKKNANVFHIGKSSVLLSSSRVTVNEV